jgi:hypothetical protein
MALSAGPLRRGRRSSGKRPGGLARSRRSRSHMLPRMHPPSRPAGSTAQANGKCPLLRGLSAPDSALGYDGPQAPTAAGLPASPARRTWPSLDPPCGIAHHLVIHEPPRARCAVPATATAHSRTRGSERLALGPLGSTPRLLTIGLALRPVSKNGEVAQYLAIRDRRYAQSALRSCVTAGRGRRTAARSAARRASRDPLKANAPGPAPRWCSTCARLSPEPPRPAPSRTRGTSLRDAGRPQMFGPRHARSGAQVSEVVPCTE